MRKKGYGTGLHSTHIIIGRKGSGKIHIVSLVFDTTKSAGNVDGWIGFCSFRYRCDISLICLFF